MGRSRQSATNAAMVARYSVQVASGRMHPLQRTSLLGMSSWGMHTLADPQASHSNPS